jgi:outer membrane protein OmpA-like peptidoglycan-associated protein
MKKYIQLFLCLLMITAAGCSKKKNKAVKNQPTPKKSHVKTSKKSAFDENLQAFALDDASLHNFAHDKNSPQQNQDLSANGSDNANSMFQWENATADQSKQEFKTIYFEFDKYTITPEQTAALNSDIQYAQKMINAGKVIVIEGHACDSAGSAVYNMTLSEKRAKFIASKFAEAGIEKSSIKIAARGQEMPIIKGGNKHKQAVNRRVEVFAIDAN